MGVIYKKGCRESHYIKPYYELIQRGEMLETKEQLQAQEQMRDSIVKNELQGTLISVGIIACIIIAFMLIFN